MIEPSEPTVSATAIGMGTALAMAILGWLTFFLRFGERVTKTEEASKAAVQVGAENEESIKLIHNAIERGQHDAMEDRETIRREFGETGLSLRQKIHEMEKWMRDEFVREKTFDAVLLRMEKAQEQRDERLDQRLGRIEDKLDDKK